MSAVWSVTVSWVQTLPSPDLPAERLLRAQLLTAYAVRKAEYLLLVMDLFYLIMV